MAWITPKTDWTTADGVAYTDLNRIEGDISFIAGNPSGNILLLAPDGGPIQTAADIQFTDTESRIGLTTADTSDTGRLALFGGGALSTSRGAYILFHGNEHASEPGNILIQSAVGHLEINTDTLIGTTTRTRNGESVRLSSVGDTYQFYGAHIDTDNTQKTNRIVSGTYNNNVNPLGMLYSICNNTENTLSIGGGSSFLTAPTVIIFRTASTIDVVNGSEAMRINSDQSVTFAGAVANFVGVTVSNKIHGSTITDNVIFDTLSPFVSTIGDELIVNGAFDGGSGSQLVLTYVERLDANNVRFFYTGTTGVPGFADIVNGGATTRNWSIVW